MVSSLSKCQPSLILIRTDLLDDFFARLKLLLSGGFIRSWAVVDIVEQWQLPGTRPKLKFLLEQSISHWEKIRQKDLGNPLKNIPLWPLKQTLSVSPISPCFVS